LRLGDAAVAIILAERVVSHGYIYKPGSFFCQMEIISDQQSTVSDQLPRED
jgi:hypothetical protein